MDLMSDHGSQGQLLSLKDTFLNFCLNIMVNAADDKKVMVMINFNKRTLHYLIRMAINHKIFHIQLASVTSVYK